MGSRSVGVFAISFSSFVILSSVCGVGDTATPAPTSGTAACTLISGGGSDLEKKICQIVDSDYFGLVRDPVIWLAAWVDETLYWPVLGHC